MTFIEQLKENSKAWEEFGRWLVYEFYQLENSDFKPGRAFEKSYIHDFCMERFEMQSGVFMAFLDSRNLITYLVPSNKEAQQRMILINFEILNSK